MAIGYVYQTRAILFNTGSHNIKKGHTNALPGEHLGRWRNEVPKSSRAISAEGNSQITEYRAIVFAPNRPSTSRPHVKRKGAAPKHKPLNLLVPLK